MQSIIATSSDIGNNFLGSMRGGGKTISSPHPKIEGSQRQRLRLAERTIMTYETNGRERSRVEAVPRRFWTWTVLLILVLAAVPATASTRCRSTTFPCQRRRS